MPKRKPRRSDGSLIFGFDPGKTGALVAWKLDGGKEPALVIRYNDNPEGFCHEVKRHQRKFLFGMIENVAASPQMGKVSCFSFGRDYGVVLGALYSAKVGFSSVTPPTWQRAMGCLTGGNKNVSKNKAIELWPSYKWIHATADAALIAEYARRQMVAE